MLASISIILPIVTLGIIALWSRYYFKSWFAPGCFFTLFWFLVILLSQIIAPEFPTYPIGLWFIVSFAIALILGSLAVPYKYYSLHTNYFVINDIKIFIQRKSALLLSIIAAFSLVSVLGIIWLLIFGVRRFEMDYTIVSLLTLPNQMYVDKDLELLVVPWYISYLTYFIMPASLLGGFLSSFSTVKSKIICFSPFILALIIGVIYSTRQGILLSLVLILSGIFSANVLLKKDLDLTFNLRSVIIAASGIIGLVCIWIFLQWLRGGADSNVFLLSFLDRLKNSILGTTAAFSVWLRTYQPMDISYGLYTFAGPADLFGLRDRPLGFYTDFVALPHGYTNIYTVFRGLIHDFTIPGTLFLGILVGYLATVSFIKCISGHIVSLLPLSLFYAFTLFSFLISIFSSNSTVAAWVISFPVIFLLHLENNKFKIN